MHRVWLFLHLLGIVLWLGGALSMMVMRVFARREDAVSLGVLARLQAGVARVLVGPGAGAVLFTGIIMTMQLYGGMPPMWLLVMTIAGFAAGIITLAVTVPTAGKLARLDPAGEYADYVKLLRDRQRLWSSISGTLGLIALVAGALR